MAPRYPSSPAARTRWVLDRRAGIVRDPHLSPDRVSHSLRETEPDGTGGTASILTLFLTNRECPWRCLMCDLWRHTLEERIPAGSALRQVDAALAADRSTGLPQADWLKLYNAGSFFDPGAIPAADLPGIAERSRAFQRLVVECHPRLVGPRVLTFREALGDSTRLEVALGLETSHPTVLDRLNKGFDLAEFRDACAFLRRNDIDVRVFVLVRPPFLGERDALRWAVRSTRFAFDCGASVVTLIPTRSGNGALEVLQARGLFAPPKAATLEVALRRSLGLGRGRVFADTWDLGRLDMGGIGETAFRSRIEALNRTQDPAWRESGH